MTTVAYPAGLPCPQTSVVTPAERRALSQDDRPREARALQRDRLDFERITWPPMDTTKAGELLTWWRETLIFGGAWFAAPWPLPRGIVTAVRKFREQPRWQYVAGGFWRLSALCEVRGRGELPQTHNFLDNLISHWTFDEADAGTTYYDSVGTNNLQCGSAGSTLINTAAGKIDAAGTIFPNLLLNHQLVLDGGTFDTAFDFGDESFSIGAWFKFASAGNPDHTQRLISRWYSHAGNNSRHFGIFRDSSSGAVLAAISADGGVGTTIAGTIAPTSWNLLTIAYDADANLFSFWVNATLVDSVPHAGGCWTGGDAAFSFGRSSSRVHGLDSTGTPIEFNHDDGFVFGRALKQVDIDHIYNGGAGLSDWT